MSRRNHFLELQLIFDENAFDASFIQGLMFINISSADQNSTFKALLKEGDVISTKFLSAEKLAGNPMSLVKSKKGKYFEQCTVSPMCLCFQLSNIDFRKFQFDYK